MPIFVFLSHQYSQNSTPIDILHSLIFQFVLENQDLRAILCNTFASNRRDLKSSTSFARDTLIVLLQSVEVAHIVIDGLDEIEERGRVLQELLFVWQRCENVKILISSRKEEDIVRMLPVETKRIWIGSKNIGNLQYYVSQRIRDWFSAREFDEQTQSEIRDLLLPLASFAKGT
jgi:hypothetical protein